MCHTNICLLISLPSQGVSSRAENHTIYSLMHVSFICPLKCCGSYCMPGTVLYAECAEENITGVILSILAPLRGFLNSLHLFQLVLFEFASRQPLFGMAVCWLSFFKLDL